jgi:peptidoglycan hydrolase-like protein with peptidoglycan-binding domain
VWGIVTSPAPKLGDRTLRAGSKGSDVRELQNLANKIGARLVVDGVFGPATQAWVRDFQKARKLTVDGIAGPRTIAAVRSATKPKPSPKPAGHRAGTRTVRRGMSGDDVAFVQRFIGERQCGEPSGTFDPRTESGVRWYQRMQGIDDDGVVGRITWAKMRVTIAY